MRKLFALALFLTLLCSVRCTQAPAAPVQAPVTASVSAIGRTSPRPRSTQAPVVVPATAESALPATAAPSTPPDLPAGTDEAVRTFYLSLLAAQDDATRQAYLDLFTPERQAELWAQLPPDAQTALAESLGSSRPAWLTPAVTPAPTAAAATLCPPTPSPAAALCLEASAACRADDGTYTLTLAAWATASGPGTECVLRYTLGDGLTMDDAAGVQVWAAARTGSGWDAAKQPLPQAAVRVDRAAGRVEVSGFDYTARQVSDTARLDGDGHTDHGARLVVQLYGLRPARAIYGGCAVPVGEGEIRLANGESIPFPETAVDLPLRSPALPADLCVYLGNTVDLTALFGRDDLPDGQNNAAVTLRYTVETEDGQTLGNYIVPAGRAFADGWWLGTPAAVTACADERCTVTVQLSAARTACGCGPADGRAVRLSAAAPVTVRVLLPELPRPDLRGVGPDTDLDALSAQLTGTAAAALRWRCGALYADDPALAGRVAGTPPALRLRCARAADGTPYLRVLAGTGQDITDRTIFLD